MPVEIDKFAVNGPNITNSPAPLLARPTEKWVAVADEPVHAGNVTKAALVACVGVVPETVHPAELRATATRA